VAGLVLGGAISVLAFYVARYGPSGGNWSFKGNGALAVYTVFPPVIAAGWTALVLLGRGRRGWLYGGIAAGLVGLLIAFAAAAILPVLGVAADQAWTPVLLGAVLLWTLAAPILAATLRVVVAREGGSFVLSLVAGALWLVAAAAGLATVGALIPAGS
jgi:hypothetical protein